MVSKICSKCGLDKRLEEFHKASTGRHGRRGDCISCVRKRQKSRYDQLSDHEKGGHNRKIPCSCGGMKTQYSDSCQKCRQFDPENPTWRVASDGYVIASSPDGEIRQHRWLMERHLRRELADHETVHHKNGIRDDNRIENLELWSTSQPAGQRVVDKLEWCRDFLAQYEETWQSGNAAGC